MRFIIVSFLIIFSLACDTTESNMGFSFAEHSFYVNKAWEQISEGEKETIITPLNEAKIERGYITSNQEYFHLVVLESIGTPTFYITPVSRFFDDETRIVAVSFNTTYDALLGPLTLLLIEEDGLLLGYLPRL